MSSIEKTLTLLLQLIRDVRTEQKAALRTIDERLKRIESALETRGQ